jgi:hypothetical protein
MISPQIANTAINQVGLEALGLASGQLAQRWTDSTPTYDASAMTLSSTDAWRAMTGGVFTWHAFGAPALTDATGAPLSDVVGVFSFHSQAALRIRRLAGARFDGRTDGLAVRPTPFFAAIRNGDPPAEILAVSESDPPLAPIHASVKTELSRGTLTFHDDQGLIIDPVPVASMFLDLMITFTALRTGSTGAGDVSSIAGLVSGPVRRVHIVNLFGGPWVDPADGVGLRIGTGSRLDSGPHEWPDGQALQASATDPGNLRFGFAPEGTLGTTTLNPPSFPATPVPSGSSAPSLNAQFFRVAAVDLGLHLRGNRSADSVEGVPGADDDTVLEPAPVVRDGDTLAFLRDGQATTGAVSEAAGVSGFRLAASPTVATDVAFPANRADRWPAAPTTTETPQALSAEISSRARTEMSAAYAGAGPDVVVTWPAGSLPVEAHVRVFPRVDPGPAIVPLAELDFARRGEGAAGIAKAAGLTLLVKDPFRVGTGTPPADPSLRFDLLIVTRAGAVQGRLMGGLEVNVASGGTAPSEPPVTNALDALPLDQRGIAPAPIIGLPSTAPATGSDPVLGALGEAAPRQSPRFRTMARMDSVVAGHDGGTPGSWQAINTPGFLDGRSVRGDADLGNPGNPAGPEDHAPGVRVTRRLALDLARAALRRTHHLATRLPELDDNRWNVPTAGTGNFAGALLQNVAATVESPELDLVPETVVHALPGDWSGLISAIQSFLPPALNPLISAIPAPGAGDRWVEEVRREAFAAKHGRRDSQWNWRWAIAHARQLVYIETPLFASTAAGTDPHEVDLVNLLRDRLAAAPDLRVIIAVPKRIPFGPGYESFAQYFHQARNAAIAALQAAAPKRVVAFHPVGFPGRPEVIRGTVAVIDDVWALVGSSSFSRRGLTFDGSIDVAFLDKTITRGSSSALRELRRNAMARTLTLAPPTPGETANASWVRLAQPVSAFKLVQEIVARGGDGLVEPLWPGLPETELPAVDRAIADPEGRGFPSVLELFASILADLGPNRV